jgi:GNAT superfamily N-acetyltransferase
MSTGIEVFAERPVVPAVINRESYTSGCIGRIVDLHARYYSQASGFGLTFEAKVARELAQFCERLQRGRDGIWLLECDGQVQGSVCIDAGGPPEQEGAHLRWFIVADALRGQGWGRELLARAMAWVDACGYARTYLWTFKGLDAARHLYASQGFVLVHEQLGQQWGVSVQEQRFERMGRPAAAAL